MSGDKRDRLSVMVFPASEKTLSLGTLVHLHLQFSFSSRKNFHTTDNFLGVAMTYSIYKSNAVISMTDPGFYFSQFWIKAVKQYMRMHSKLKLS